MYPAFLTLLVEIANDIHQDISTNGLRSKGSHLIYLLGSVNDTDTHRDEFALFAKNIIDQTLILHPSITVSSNALTSLQLSLPSSNDKNDGSATNVFAVIIEWSENKKYKV